MPVYDKELAAQVYIEAVSTSQITLYTVPENHTADITVVSFYHSVGSNTDALRAVYDGLTQTLTSSSGTAYTDDLFATNYSKTLFSGTELNLVPGSECTSHVRIIITENYIG